MPEQNKYARLLENTSEDLKALASVVAGINGVPSLGTLQELASAIEQLKVARLSFQVWEDAKKS